MELETVDPLTDRYPAPYTGQYPLTSTYCTMQMRAAAPSEARKRDLRNGWPTHCNACAATQGKFEINKFKLFIKFDHLMNNK